MVILYLRSIIRFINREGSNCSCLRFFSIWMVILLLAVNYLLIMPVGLTGEDDAGILEDSNSILSPSSSTRGVVRGARSFGFILNGTGLPTSNDYNYIAVGDIDKAGHLDIASGSQSYSSAASSEGLYYYRQVSRHKHVARWTQGHGSGHNDRGYLGDWRR